jgi:DNA-binding beta-propeller fold protein YncE
MRAMTSILFAAAALMTAGASCAADVALTDGGWDYVSFDAATHSVLVGRSQGASVIDVATGKARLVGVALVRNHQALSLNGGKEILITSGQMGEVGFVDGVTGEVTTRLKVGKKPDAALVDPATGLVFVMDNADGGVDIVDTKSHTLVGHIVLPGALEEAVADGSGRIYVNVEDKAEVAVIDTRARSVSAHYPLTGCEGPTGLALDPKAGRLVSACANKVAVVTDATTGAIKGSLAIGPGPDGAAYDAKSGLVFVPTGRDGKLTAIDAAAVKVMKVLDSEKSARTGDLDPVGGVFYSVAATFEAPKPGVARAPAIPGTVHLVSVSIR